MIVLLTKIIIFCMFVFSLLISLAFARDEEPVEKYANVFEEKPIFCKLETILFFVASAGIFHTIFLCRIEDVVLKDIYTIDPLFGFLLFIAGFFIPEMLMKINKISLKKIV